jgi:hypothetical protein
MTSEIDTMTIIPLMQAQPKIFPIRGKILCGLLPEDLDFLPLLLLSLGTLPHKNDDRSENRQGM